MKKKFSAYDIALSALSCAMATVLLTVGVYSEILLFTGYLFGAISLMLPLAKQSYRGYALAYVATNILAVLFNPGRIFDLLPFICFFGLHPLINELQLKIKINRWVACAIKALWFDVTMYLIWFFLFDAALDIPIDPKYIIPLFAVFGSICFVFFDYAMYKWRYAINRLVKRINKK